MLVPLRRLTLCCVLLASLTATRARSDVNVFFGFDYTLTPIAVKWSCGGKPDQDLVALHALMARYPEDAKAAELQSGIDMMLEASKRETALSEIFGVELSEKQKEQFCDAALKLELPLEELTSDDENADTSEQEAAWEAFYMVLEDFQNETNQ